MLRNISSNVLGTILPSLAALVAVPLLIQKLGMGGFGTFSLQVAALFFFGLADMGISRAIVLLSFEPSFASAGRWRKPYRVGVQFSAWLAAGVAMLGIPVGLALDFRPPQGALGAHDLAISTAIVFVCAGLTLLMQAPRAVLEAQERFALANAIRGPAAATIFLAPLAALQVNASLTSAAVSLLISRVIALVAFMAACGQFSDAQLRIPFAAGERAELRRLFFAKAGWLGATNLLSMLLAYLDRFVLGWLGTPVLVGQYVVAQEVVTKAWISAGSVISAATPRLASAAAGERGNSQPVVRQMFFWMLLGGVLPALILIVFGEPLLQLWLRRTFSPESVLPMQVMAVGLGVNTIAQINFALLQVQGGVREGAYLQILNLVLLGAGLLLAVPALGVNGAALVFSVRLVIDAFAGRFLLKRRLAGAGRGGVGSRSLLAIVVLLVLALVAVRGLRPWG